jgi:redox-regulated HSP33 family molecular chaperone
MPDHLLRGECPELDVRLFLLQTSEVCETINQYQKTSGLAKQIFFKCLGASLLSAPLLTDDERVTLRWQYSGEIGTITTDVNAKGGLRAYPEVAVVNSEDAFLAYGSQGKLGLVKSNSYRRLNSGMTLADQADPARDLATYFEISDQIPTI